MDATKPIQDWIVAQCRQGNYRVSVSDAHASYGSWARERDQHAWVESIKLFSMRLAQLGYGKARGNKRRYNIGLRMLTNEEKLLII